MSTPAPSASSEPVQLKCADCGYDLRGLTTDSRCPECGLSIAASLARDGNFTRHQLAVLACRILALWVLVHFGLHLATAAVGVLWTFDANRGPWNMTWLGLIAAGVPLLANFALAGSLWFLSPWIGRRIFSENAPLRIGGQVGVWDILPLAPLGVGVVFVAMSVRSTLHVLTTLGLGVPFDRALSDMAHAVSYLLVGATLLVGGPRIVQGIKWLRTAGQVTGAP